MSATDARTDLVLACHAEAGCDVAGIVGGPRGCTGLTDRGRGQAQRLAARLAAEHWGRRFDVLYTSPRRRARDTADIVAGVLGLPATVANPLRDLDPGDADGRPRHTVDNIDAGVVGSPEYSPDQPYAPGAETWNQYLRRATAAMQAIVRRHRGQRILVVGHPETVAACHVGLLGLAPEVRLGLRFRTDPAGLTWWRREIDTVGMPVWTLIAHNDTSHLTGGPGPGGREAVGHAG
jgi:probable phosphoglycerate mutase